MSVMPPADEGVWSAIQGDGACEGTHGCDGFMSDIYYNIASRHNGIWNEHWMDDDECAREYYATRACSSDLEQRYCPYDKLELQLAPKPLNSIVTGSEAGFSGCLNSPVVMTLREDARRISEPFLPQSVWGDVHKRDGRRLVHTGHYTCLLPRSEWVNGDRGHNYLEKKLCPVCGQVNWLSSEAKHVGILRRESRERPVVVSENLFLYVTPEFFESQQLKQRLPDIKICRKVKVYEEDPAGWVLPGDPGWNGVLVQRKEPPKISKGKERGKKS